MADLTMLRKELLIGYTIAGFLATSVPARAWNVVFLHGHGFWTSLENVLVGPLIAVLSFVCSIGNVPLAAALWHGGISFGGVVSFIFADLITFPLLLLVYRRYYGTRLTLRVLVLLWAVMATAGLLTEGIFRMAGMVPASRTATVAPTHFRWNATSSLNIVFLVLFGLLYWAYRNRWRLGGGDGYGIDPVCGMQVEISLAPASARSGAGPPRLLLLRSLSLPLRGRLGGSTRGAGPPGARRHEPGPACRRRRWTMTRLIPASAATDRAPTAPTGLAVPGAIVTDCCTSGAAP